MKALHRLSIPLVTLVLVGVPVFWAFPDDLPVARSAGIVLGWVGCGLLLANLLLMLREVRLTEFFGSLERMYTWHHVLGTLAYLVLLVHPLAFAVDAAQHSAHQAWATLSPWRERWPIWLGWAALICLMCGLAAAFSRKLGYPVWRWLHGLLVLAVLFGFAHLILLGLSQTLLFALLLATVLMLWRVLRIDCGLAARPFLVDHVETHANGVLEISLRPLATLLNAKPGQFAMFAFFDGPHFQGCREYHPYTISAVDSDGKLRIGVKSLGGCTHQLQSLTAGVAVRVQGPFGSFLRDRGNGPELWVAGGIGITPFIAVLRGEPLGHPVRLHYFYREPADAAYVEELRTLASRQATLDLEIRVGLGDAQALANTLPDAGTLAGCRCYLCGPPGLLSSVIGILESRDVPQDAIYFERFDFR
ncbi:Ferric reductase domain protein protein transmembrane component domain protein [Candidatus Propionivibrio aalborgensis]|uniref:Ferric reductase domain protein protein transmembrane component domain protein n=1 Tax=Candidatus Propionivibrio aalborgensis TaxID=1860101 RepID=A0A1A8XH30_9RHOO|nr:ferredoxin reductase family protein [Candidatus Propionivibrio aalborgensis]SBT04489.1 Ferric reductase domain protein protein transmembrane component domain protein [Candidatus Propionivibrio aalborgensis]